MMPCFQDYLSVAELASCLCLFRTKQQALQPGGLCHLIYHCCWIRRLPKYICLRSPSHALQTRSRQRSVAHSLTLDAGYGPQHAFENVATHRKHVCDQHEHQEYCLALHRSCVLNTCMCRDGMLLQQAQHDELHVQ